VDESDLPEPVPSTSEDFFASGTRDFPTLEELELRYIRTVLEKTGGKKEQAAQILGINRRTLYRKEREAGWVREDSTLDDAELGSVDGSQTRFE
jgi:DNA-binding NtrC family response regulator